MTKIEQIYHRYRRIPKRAEREPDVEKLVQSFVNIAGIDDIIYNPENQIFFGRRGTGKTHALNFIRSKVITGGNVAIYIDLRSIGSEGSLWADVQTPREIRVAKVVTDIFAAVHEELYEYATLPNSNIDLGSIGQEMDDLADSISRVIVVDDVETSSDSENAVEFSSDSEVNLSWRAALSASIRGGSSTRSREAKAVQKKEKGRYQHKIHFQSMMLRFRDLLRSVGKRVWILFDEWSAIPEEVQPFVADAIRRVLFPIPSITVIFAAIEHRSSFRIGSTRNYVGIELGADCPAAVDFDDFMVLDNNPEQSREFFEKLLYSHFVSVNDAELDSVNVQSSKELVKKSFTRISTFK